MPCTRTVSVTVSDRGCPFGRAESERALVRPTGRESRPTDLLLAWRHRTWWPCAGAAIRPRAGYNYADGSSRCIQCTVLYTNDSIRDHVSNTDHFSGGLHLGPYPSWGPPRVSHLLPNYSTPPRYCKRQMLRTSKTPQNAHRLTHRSQVCGDRVSKTGDRTRSTGLSCQMIVNSSACGLRVKFVWDQHVQPA